MCFSNEKINHILYCLPRNTIVIEIISIHEAVSNSRYVLETFLTLKASITTAADDIHKYLFIVFQRKYDLMFQVNPLLGRGFT